MAHKALSAISSGPTAALAGLSERQLICIYICAHWALGISSFDGSLMAAVYGGYLTAVLYTHKMAAPTKLEIHMSRLPMLHTSTHFRHRIPCSHPCIGLPLNFHLLAEPISTMQASLAWLIGRLSTPPLLRSCVWPLHPLLYSLASPGQSLFLLDVLCVLIQSKTG